MEKRNTSSGFYATAFQLHYFMSAMSFGHPNVDVAFLPFFSLLFFCASGQIVDQERSFFFTGKSEEASSAHMPVIRMQ